MAGSSVRYDYVIFLISILAVVCCIYAGDTLSGSQWGCNNNELPLSDLEHRKVCRPFSVASLVRFFLVCPYHTPQLEISRHYKSVVILWAVIHDITEILGSCWRFPQHHAVSDLDRMNRLYVIVWLSQPTKCCPHSTSTYSVASIAQCLLLLV